MAEAQEEQQQRLDLEELTKLKGLSKRPRVVALLSAEILALTDQLPKVAPATAPPVPAVVSSPAAPPISYVSLSSFSWDQDTDKIKIYVSLGGVEQDKVDAVFKPTSVEVKFHGVQGKNYRCAIPKLNKEIEPEKCKVVIKPSRVIITLQKSTKGNWLDLFHKEDKFKPTTDKEKDPMAGIMDLMKNMYEEGDDDMRRTIAKAWSDARSGKTVDPLKAGFP
ncbi:uncharacterized protein LOC144703303 [Wolffia australiana]